MDTFGGGRQNLDMSVAAVSRACLTSTLQEAYTAGLISEATLAMRLDEVLHCRIINPERLVGDLQIRADEVGLKERISQTMHTVVDLFGSLFAASQIEQVDLLALDWSGEPEELVIGRSPRCDIVVGDLSVSRRHARLIRRDSRWGPPGPRLDERHAHQRDTGGALRAATRGPSGSRRRSLSSRLARTCSRQDPGMGCRPGSSCFATHPTRRRISSRDGEARERVFRRGSRRSNLVDQDQPIEAGSRWRRETGKRPLGQTPRRVRTHQGTRDAARGRK